jgi:ABC-type tungstate transport system permease subunit
VVIASVGFGCGHPPPPTLDIATTTSVQNSGLLSHLLPVFEQASGIVVRVHAAGSGRALQMLADGTVDAAIVTHLKRSEGSSPSIRTGRIRRLRTTGLWCGPDSDPAAVRSSSDVLDAFRRIADSASLLSLEATSPVRTSGNDHSGMRGSASSRVATDCERPWNGPGAETRDEARAYILPTHRRFGRCRRRWSCGASLKRTRGW